MVRGKKPTKKHKQAKQSRDTGANLGFEAKIWAAAVALRNSMDAADLAGLVFVNVHAIDEEPGRAPFDDKNTAWERCR